MQGSRIVTDSVFSSKTATSYALVVYCKNTGRWVIVQRKHSNSFILFLTGHFRKSYIRIMLSEMTATEKEIVKSCCEDLSSIPLLCRNNYIPFVSEADQIIQENREYILEEIEKSKEAIALKWTWPKGRFDYSLDVSYRDTAIREFMEEVEIELPVPLYISDNFITEEKMNFDRKKSITHCWIYIIENEIDLPEVKNNPEVADRLWVSTKELRELIDCTITEEIISEVNRILDI